MENAIQVFPQELWELIVDKLEDAEDIRIFLKAFPELRHLLNGQHFSWLVGDLMPLIMSKFLTFDDIRSCRLVSKRWCYSVGNILETHPSRRPYKSARTPHISEHHINNSCAINITTNLQKFVDSGYDFIAGGPVITNPFPGRQISASVYIPYPDAIQYTNLVKALPALRVFGHHVWYFSVDFTCGYTTTEESFIETGLKPLFDCLSCLPNLRSLGISGCGVFKKGQTERIKLAWDTPLKNLPFQLETLDMRSFYNFPEDIYSNIIYTFGCFGGIQKLKIEDNKWKKTYGALFPNLKELDMSADENDIISVIFNVLNDLSTPGFLRKVHISSSEMNICDFLNELANYPCQIESLQLDIAKLRDQIWDQDTVFPTIHALQINLGSEIATLKFQFLKAFPELKYMSVVCTVFDELDDDFTPDEDNMVGASFCRFVLEDRIDSNNFVALWEELAKLQMLTVIHMPFQSTYQYVRECPGKVFVSDGIQYDLRVPEE